MKKMLILPLVLFSVQSNACDNLDAAVTSIVSAYSKTVNLDCSIESYKPEFSQLKLNCKDSLRNHYVSYRNNELFSLIFSKQSYNAIHQCYYVGSVKTETCEASFEPMKCDVVSLDK